MFIYLATRALVPSEIYRLAARSYTERRHCDKQHRWVSWHRLFVENFPSFEWRRETLVLGILKTGSTRTVFNAES